MLLGSLNQHRFALLFSLSLFISTLYSSTQALADETLEVKTFDYNQLNNSGQNKGQVLVTAGDIDVWGAGYSLLPTTTSPNYLSVLQPCENDVHSVCIEELAYRSLGATNWKRGRLELVNTPSADGAACLFDQDGTAPHRVGTNNENVIAGIPFGKTPSIYQLPDAQHGGGSQYLLSVSVSTFPRSVYQSPLDFAVNLRPIKFSTHQIRPSGPCLSHEAFSQYFNFPTNTEYRLVVRLGFLRDKISTFFSGRLANPSIAVNQSTLVISGQPQLFPIAQSRVLLYESLSAERKSSIPFPESHFEKSNAGANIAMDFGSKRDFENFLLWRNELSEVGANSGWNLRSLREDYKCKLNEFSGFVTSNALIFSQRPPEWDPLTRTASYRMESLLKDQKGNPTQGDFSLALSQNLMKCLWGFTFDIGNSVEIELTGDGRRFKWDSYKVSFDEDWWYLKIRGYSFERSTVNISVGESNSVPDSRVVKSPLGTGTLDVDSFRPVRTTVAEAEAKAKAEAEAKAKAEAEAEAEAKAKKSITCSKGKVKRIVSATNPKCPKSFKRIK